MRFFTHIGAASFGLLVLTCNSASSLEGTRQNSLVYEDLTAPITIGELLKSLKLVADRRLWDRDDFYTKDTLQRIFGTQEITISTVPGKNLSFQLYGFKTLLAPQKGDRTRFSGVEMFAHKHVLRPALPGVHGASDEFDHQVRRQFQAMISGAAPGLDFSSVVNIFGGAWRENREAENELFTAITREAFNPPPPQAIGNMGNKIITYTIGSPDDIQEVSLQFDPHGLLREIDSITRYETP